MRGFVNVSGLDGLITRRFTAAREIRGNINSLEREYYSKGLNKDEFTEKRQYQIDKLKKLGQEFKEKVSQ